MARLDAGSGIGRLVARRARSGRHAERTARNLIPLFFTQGKAAFQHRSVDATAAVTARALQTRGDDFGRREDSGIELVEATGFFIKLEEGLAITFRRATGHLLGDGARQRVVAADEEMRLPAV